MTPTVIRSTGLLLCLVAVLTGCGSNVPVTYPVGNDSTQSAVKGTLTVTPTTLTFASATTRSVTAVETGSTDVLSAVSSNKKIATVSKVSQHGSRASFTVSPVDGGKCTIAIKNTTAHTAKVQVTVENGIIIINGVSPQRTSGGE